MCKRQLLPLFLAGSVLLSAVTASTETCAEIIYDAPGTDDSVIDMEETLLPGAFDIRDEGMTPVVTKQGNNGTCWALTACSAMEAALMPQQHLRFSADHMSMNNGFEITQSEGGDFKMIMAYLSSWQGPVFEWQDPYGDGESDDTLEPAVHVQEMRLYTEPDRETVKKQLMTYGAVHTSLYMENSMAKGDTLYYKEETAGFFCSQEYTPTHDVLILGWDDSYSKENFAVQPEADGAWICQNSWGEAFGEDGTFYLSYEDANALKHALVYSVIEDKDNYDRIYQTDSCGWQGAAGFSGSETCYMANVYTADAQETISAAGFYSTGTDTDYEVFVVHDCEDTSSFEKMEKAGEGHIDAKGYFTVALEDEKILAAGERFAVVVKITTAGKSKNAAVEMRKDAWTQNITLEGKEGYLSRDSINWENTETLYQANVCLKVYTNLCETEETTEYGS